jgi:phosphopantetheinyl transferase (holo-ACP synthase)
LVKIPKQEREHENGGQMEHASIHGFWRTFAIKEAVVKHATVLVRRRVVVNNVF